MTKNKEKRKVKGKGKKKSKKQNIIYKDLLPFKDNICETTLFNTKVKDRVGRQELFKSQRQTYGFDERETWSLEQTSVLWIYAHLKRYLDWACVELYNEEVCHMYNVEIVSKDQSDNYLYDWIDIETKSGVNYRELRLQTYHEELSEGKIIELICEYLEQYMQADCIDNRLELALAQHAIKLYADILPSLWW